MMYTIKQKSEDFIVKEISTVIPREQGRYGYFLLKKKQRNTLDVVKEISRRLNIREKQIGFAGSKDKHGITEQVISITGVSREKVLGLILDTVTLGFLGYGDSPLCLGDLAGNSFEIVVRNVSSSLKKEEIVVSAYLENYFDEQRFSSHNVIIGKALLLKDFAEAVKHIRKEECEQHLRAHPADYVGALRLLPMRLLRMYINAFQSSLWNKTMAEYLKSQSSSGKSVPFSQGELFFMEEPGQWKELKIPLVGFGEIATEDPAITEIIKRLLQEEAITMRDFIIKQIPEITVEGELRSAVVEVKEILVDDIEDDELNPGMKKVRVTFTLPKGSYATMAIKRTFSASEH